MSDLEIEFEKFDRANPQIWKLFERFCADVIESGRRKLGARVIIERIRWEVYIVTKSEDDFKINDHHTPYYSRKWLKTHPDHPGFFETRKVRGDDNGGDGYHFDGDGQGNLFL
jgi:hypothetical protein